MREIDVHIVKVGVQLQVVLQGDFGVQDGVVSMGEGLVHLGGLEGDLVQGGRELTKFFLVTSSSPFSPTRVFSSSV